MSLFVHRKTLLLSPYAEGTPRLYSGGRGIVKPPCAIGSPRWYYLFLRLAGGVLPSAGVRDANYRSKRASPRPCPGSPDQSQ